MISVYKLLLIVSFLHKFRVMFEIALAAPSPGWQKTRPRANATSVRQERIDRKNPRTVALTVWFFYHQFKQVTLIIGKTRQTVWRANSRLRKAKKLSTEIVDNSVDKKVFEGEEKGSSSINCVLHIKQAIKITITFYVSFWVYGRSLCSATPLF